MQHWHVYRKWNGRLFQEMYKAFGNQRADVNPADEWYQGEIDFFDFNVIPLAQKLKDCGVFGVAGDELLNYAQQNRQEWARDGKKAVQTMLKAMRLETDGPMRGVSRYTSGDSIAIGSARGSGRSTRRPSHSPNPRSNRKPLPRKRQPNRRASAGSEHTPPKNRPPSRRPSAGSEHTPPKNRPPSRRPSAGSENTPPVIPEKSNQKQSLLQSTSLDPSDRSSADVASKDSKRKELLKESTKFSVDDLEDSDDHVSFVNLNDADDDGSHQSELTEDSYARKGKKLKLPEELNVLIIDDDNINRRLFTRAVMSVAPKWIVSEVESIQEALEVIENSTDVFDVIFMDHHAGSIIGETLGTAAVKLLRIKGVNCLICAMSSRDKEVMFDTGDAFGDTPLLFEPKALIKEVTKIMYQSADFSW